MKKRYKLLCMLLAFVLVMHTFVLSAPAKVYAADNNQTYYVTPELSDGITAVALDPSSLVVKGTLSSDGKMFTFSENATLSFTVATEDGWTYSDKYSCFFESDEGNRTIAKKNNTITFTYEAKSGRSVAFSDLAAVLINATPDKLPVLRITVPSGINSVGKEDWVEAGFKLEAGTKVFESGNTYEGTGEIKGRGNNSWGSPQKPYSIKLEKKASLLGIPKTKKYAIVSTYADTAVMRNYIAYKSALSMIGIQYSPKIEFVEVYIDGEYRGIYSLVERIDIEETKINIEEVDPESGNWTGGYIIEKDFGEKVDWNNDPWIWSPFQANPADDVFTLSAPDPDDEGKMLEYLEGYLYDLHDALMSSEEEALEYVDYSSWADFLILQELAKNIDGNLKTSCYFVKEKDNQALRMDAPWDFDLAFGNPKCGWTNGDRNRNDYDDCPNSTSFDRFMVINSSCPWFQKLYSYSGFNALTKERYSKYRAEMIPDMQNMIYEQAAYLSKAMVSHRDRWHDTDFTSSVDTLQNFLNGRIGWLDSQWLNKEDQTLALNTVTEGNGSVSASSAVIYATSTAVTIEPDAGNKIETVLWNGIDVTDQVTNGVYLTPIMTEKAELTVTFVKDAPEVDKSALIALVETTDSYDEESYKPSTWAELEAALDSANGVIESETATQDDVQQAIDVLNEAIAGLENRVDVRELEALVEQIEGFDTEGYTSASVNELEAALEEAARFLAEDALDADEQDLADAIEALQGAFDALEIDKSSLSQAIDSAIEQIGRFGEDHYTPDSLAALNEALTRAQAVLADEAATREDVDTAYHELDDAIKALEEKQEPIEPPTEEDPEPPTEEDPEPPTGEDPEQPSEDEIPGTGDAASYKIPLIILLLSAAGLFIVIKLRKKV